MHPPGPLEPTRVIAHACADDIDAYDEAGQGFFEMALRFGLNAHREPAHISLIALARLAQWAGFYVRRLVALVRNGAFTILTVTASMHDNLAVRAADDVCYAQILNPV